MHNHLKHPRSLAITNQVSALDVAEFALHLWRREKLFGLASWHRKNVGGFEKCRRQEALGDPCYGVFGLYESLFESTYLCGPSKHPSEITIKIMVLADVYTIRLCRVSMIVLARTVSTRSCARETFWRAKWIR